MFPEINTNRLWLRQIQSQDLPQIFKGLSHPDVIRFYGVNYQSIEETKAQMDWFAYLEKTKTGIWWAVCSKKTKEFLGAGGINNVDRINLTAELGYWLLPQYWSNGFMTESLPHIIAYAFESFGLNQVVGIVESKNEICKKSITRFGFIPDPSLNFTEYKNGSFIKLEVYIFHKNTPFPTFTQPKQSL